MEFLILVWIGSKDPSENSALENNGSENVAFAMIGGSFRSSYQTRISHSAEETELEAEMVKRKGI